METLHVGPVVRARNTVSDYRNVLLAEWLDTVHTNMKRMAGRTTIGCYANTLNYRYPHGKDIYGKNIAAGTSEEGRRIEVMRNLLQLKEHSHYVVVSDACR